MAIEGLSARTVPFMQPDALISGYKQPEWARDVPGQTRAAAAWMVVDVNCASKITGFAPLLDRIDMADSGIALFQTAGWLASAAATVLSRRNAKVHVLFAMREGMPVAALPICVRSVAGVRVALSLGDPLSQYSDILMADQFYHEFPPDTLRRAFAFFPDVDVFLFRRIREDAKLRKFIGSCGGEQICGTAAPFADLTSYADFSGYLKGHWKAHRNRNRLRRRAEDVGGLSFEMAGSMERAAELTKNAIEMKRRWLRSRLRVFGTLSSPQWCGALVRAVEFPSSSVQPAISALHAHGKPVAVEVGFVRRGRYHAFLGALDLEFAHWSPTDLLMEDTIRWCFEQNISCYDLLPPDDAYKARWTNGSTTVSDWMVCRTRAGRTYVKARYRLMDCATRCFASGAGAHKRMKHLAAKLNWPRRNDGSIG
jgi:CelD/BcsL family acetyltransferase involved in cellulose biosynthesis